MFPCIGIVVEYCGGFQCVRCFIDVHKYVVLQGRLRLGPQQNASEEGCDENARCESECAPAHIVTARMTKGVAEQYTSGLH
jgi:hypothetical protein